MSTTLYTYLDFEDPNAKKTYNIDPIRCYIYPSTLIDIDSLEAIEPALAMNINPQTWQEEITNNANDNLSPIKMTKTKSSSLSNIVNKIYENLSYEVTEKPDNLPLYKINAFDMFKSYLTHRNHQFMAFGNTNEPGPNTDLVNNLMPNVFVHANYPLQLNYDNDNFENFIKTYQLGNDATKQDINNKLSHTNLIIFHD